MLATIIKLHFLMLACLSSVSENQEKKVLSTQQPDLERKVKKKVGEQKNHIDMHDTSRENNIENPREGKFQGKKKVRALIYSPVPSETFKRLDIAHTSVLFNYL